MSVFNWCQKSKERWHLYCCGVKIFSCKSGWLTRTRKNQWFEACLRRYQDLNHDRRFSINRSDLWVCLDDNTDTTGFDTHYEYHQAWAIRKVKQINPARHVDIASKLTFNACLSAFLPVDFFDYRPALLKLDNLRCLHANLTQLHFETGSIQSLSCMHTVEHVGLGRYGDPIDPEGDIKAIKELKRVLAPGGNLLFVVPVGLPRLQYNAHRIYSYEMIIEYFSDLTLIEFSLISDNALETGIITHAAAELVARQKCGCGCFWFRKDVLEKS